MSKYTNLHKTLPCHRKHFILLIFMYSIEMLSILVVLTYTGEINILLWLRFNFDTEGKPNIIIKYLIFCSFMCTLSFRYLITSSSASYCYQSRYLGHPYIRNSVQHRYSIFLSTISSISAGENMNYRHNTFQLLALSILLKTLVTQLHFQLIDNN